MSRNTRNLIFCIVVSICMLALVAEARIVLPPGAGTASQSLYAPTMFFRNSARYVIPQEARQLVVETDLWPSLNSTRNNGYTNKIVVATPIFQFGTFNESMFRWVREACNHAAIVVLPYGLWDYFLGYPEFMVPEWFEGATCPVLTVSIPSFDAINAAYRNNTNLTVNMEGDDGPSPVHNCFKGGVWLFVTILMAASSCAVSVLGAIRLIQYFRATQNCMPIIATTCLWLEAVSAFIRFLYWSIDPFSSRMLLTSFGSQSVFRTACFPGFISSTILLTFYWYESLTTTSLHISLNVSRLRVPAYVLCALSVVLEVISWIYNLGTFPTVSNAVRSINQFYYILVAFAMCIFYIFTAVRILIALQPYGFSSHRSSQGSHGSYGSQSSHVSSTDDSDDSTKPSPTTPTSGKSSITSRQRAANRQMRTTTMKLSVSAFSLLCLCILAPMSVAAFYESSPVAHPGYLVWWCLLHTVLNIKGFSTSLAFNPPAARSKSYSNRGSGNKNSTKATSAPKHEATNSV